MNNNLNDDHIFLYGKEVYNFYPRHTTDVNGKGIKKNGIYVIVRVTNPARSTGWAVGYGPFHGEYVLQAAKELYDDYDQWIVIEPVECDVLDIGDRTFNYKKNTVTYKRGEERTEKIA